MVCGELLSRFAERTREILGDNLMGIYLHGSAAMGCFNEEKSDLDLILVVKEEIPNAVKMEFMRSVAEFNEEAPAKGIELSIVKREFCNPFVYPTPFELHFSVTHLKWFQENPEDYIEKMRGTDKDLAAHFTIIKTYGAVLYGDSLYLTLNLCRVLAYLKEGLVLSKKAGGEWAIRVLPEEFRSLVREALHSYGSDAEMTVCPETALRFADYMISQIERFLA